MRNLLASLLIAVALSTTTYAQTVITTHIPMAQKLGEGRLNVLFWDVYDASLWAPSGTWNAKQPFALSLSYLREIEGADIADRSVEEIRKLGFADEAKLAAWGEQMRRIFPNVRAGSTLTGVYKPHDGTYFYEGEREVGVIRDDAFGEWFFGIWLAENTSEPELRRQLLGG